MAKRVELNLRFLTNGPEEKANLLSQSSQYLFNTISEKILPAWYGTKWGFYGISEIPGSGEIACGRFVVYVLRDAGFNVPKRMADQPSENIIKNLVKSSKIKRFNNSAQLKNILDWIQTQGEGIFMVGLDIHVGFIIYRSGRITFCHSNYYNPPLCVVNQIADEKSPLTDSQYRVVAKLFEKEMMEDWILNREISIKYDYFR